MKVIGKVVSEEFLQKDRLDLGKHIDAALLTVKGFELCVVARLVPLFLHLSQQNRLLFIMTPVQKYPNLPGILN